jgi:prepilin-type N-terminal cleavage/methylation domain-containing protein
VEQPNSRSDGPDAFSLIELLIVIAIIAIMSSLVMSYITNAAKDSRLVVALQQQVVMQEALNAWIASSNSLGDAQAAYTPSDASTMLGYLERYLKNSTETQADKMFTASGSQIRSDVLNKAGKALVFSAWGATNYPVVEMTDQ